MTTVADPFANRLVPEHVVLGEASIREAPEKVDVEKSSEVQYIESKFKTIFARLDSERLAAMTKALAEKEKVEKNMNHLKDQMALLQHTILQHQDAKVFVRKKVEGDVRDLRFTFGKFMATWFGASMQQHVVMGFFGPQTIRPEYEAIKVGPGEKDTVDVPVQAHWELPLSETWMLRVGKGENPNVQKASDQVLCEIVELHTQAQDPSLTLDEVRIHVTTTKYRRFFWDAILAEFDLFRQQKSIFKGKVIDSAFEFIPFDTIGFEDVVLHPDAQDDVDIFLRAPVQRKGRMESRGIPFKRGVLLAGKYGTGKTLLAKALAREARAKNVTFIVMKNEHLKEFARYLYKAKIYAPAILFLEDVDALVGPNRDAVANDFLNALDGLQKLGDVMVVFTTNHVDRINEAMKRPGRIDKDITIGAADLPGRLRLMDQTAKKQGISILPFTPEEIEEFDALTEGYPGSFMVEVVRGATMRSVALTDTDSMALSYQDIRWGALQLAKRAEAYRTSVPSHDSWPQGLVTDVATKVIERAGLATGGKSK